MIDATRLLSGTFIAPDKECYAQGNPAGGNTIMFLVSSSLSKRLQSNDSAIQTQEVKCPSENNGYIILGLSMNASDKLYPK